MAIAACNNSEDADLSIDGDTEPEATTPAGAAGTEAAAGDEAETDDPGTDQTGTPDGFLPPVRFENGEHETGQAVATELLQAKATEAAIAVYHNWRTRASLGYRLGSCDFDRDVAPPCSPMLKKWTKARTGSARRQVRS